jgi:hypoxanthine phosphoribosyltransferase
MKKKIAEKEKKARIYYSLSEFDQDIRKLARIIKRTGKPKNIYGKPRGGLVPAVWLSNLLERPMILEEEQIGRDTLIVDDTCDTGATLSRLANLTDLPLVTLFSNELRTIKIPRLIYVRLTHGVWVEFPWETERSSKVDHT